MPAKLTRKKLMKDFAVVVFLSEKSPIHTLNDCNIKNIICSWR